MDEVYKPYPGDKRYMVSNYGNVISPFKIFPLKMYRRLNGYMVTSLQTTQVYVHKLVLETFVGPCPKGMECRHLNGVSDDNHLYNLRWGTHQENQQDMSTHVERKRRMHKNTKELNDKLVQVGLEIGYNHERMGDRIAFLQEELDELSEAHDKAGKIALEGGDPLNEHAEMLDACVDLVVVALGTAYQNNWNFHEAWDRVHKANMMKNAVHSAGINNRDMEFDLEKPFGWTAPYLQDLVKTY